MAEGEGFEPPEPLRFSGFQDRRTTTLPSFLDLLKNKHSRLTTQDRIVKTEISLFP